jgi:hypothetical protein
VPSRIKWLPPDDPPRDPDSDPEGDPPATPLDDRVLAEVEEKLGVKLPAAYVGLMREQNGGDFESMVIRARRPVPEAIEDHIGKDRFVELHSFHGVTLGESGILQQTQYMTNAWELPSGLVLLEGDGHTWIALDYRRAANEPSVIFLESDSKQSVTLAPSFASLLAALVPYEEVYDEDGELRPKQLPWWRRWLYRPQE